MLVDCASSNLWIAHKCIESTGGSHKQLWLQNSVICAMSICIWYKALETFQGSRLRCDDPGGSNVKLGASFGVAVDNDNSPGSQLVDPGNACHPFPYFDSMFYVNMPLMLPGH